MKKLLLTTLVGLAVSINASAASNSAATTTQRHYVGTAGQKNMNNPAVNPTMQQNTNGMNKGGMNQDQDMMKQKNMMNQDQNMQQKNDMMNKQAPNNSTSPSSNTGTKGPSSSDYN